MTFLLLFFEFFKAGLFAVGGGLATLPFLTDMSKNYSWFSETELSNMIAISESTPGPIGVNMATYAGFTAGFSEGGFLLGVLGALTATIALVMPSLIIVMIVAHFLERFQGSTLVQDSFFALRPAVTALIAIAGYEIVRQSLFVISQAGISFDYVAIAIFAVIVILQIFLKKLHPIVLIAIAAVLGVIFKM